jgi:hypothetical protein
MSHSSVQRILHRDLNLHQCKLQNVHSLSDQDKEVHLQVCHQFQEIMTEDLDLQNNILTDEEHLHLHDTVNKQNL